jgi:hypothetical protein
LDKAGVDAGGAVICAAFRLIPLSLVTLVLNAQASMNKRRNNGGVGWQQGAFIMMVMMICGYCISHRFVLIFGSPSSKDLDWTDWTSGFRSVLWTIVTSVSVLPLSVFSLTVVR